MNRDFSHEPEHYTLAFTHEEPNGKKTTKAIIFVDLPSRMEFWDWSHCLREAVYAEVKESCTPSAQKP